MITDSSQSHLVFSNGDCNAFPTRLLIIISNAAGQCSSKIYTYTCMLYSYVYTYIEGCFLSHSSWVQATQYELLPKYSLCILYNPKILHKGQHLSLAKGGLERYREHESKAGEVHTRFCFPSCDLSISRDKHRSTTKFVLPSKRASVNRWYFQGYSKDRGNNELSP